jgi:hypothetical protein
MTNPKGAGMQKKDGLVALTAALCVVALLACGGGGSSTGSVSGSGGGGEGAAREEAGLAFAQCMREHGVEMEDPKSDQGGIEIPGDSNDPVTKDALAACDGTLDKVAQDVSPEEDEAFREGWLAFTQCMRDRGIDLADPQFQGAGKVQLGISGVDTTSPAFEEASEACQGKVPPSSGFGVGG